MGHTYLCLSTRENTWTRFSIIIFFFSSKRPSALLVANLHKNILFMCGDHGYSINTHLKNSLTTALYYDCFILMDKVRALISSTSCLLCNNIVLFFESSTSTLWETVSLLTFLPLTVCYSVHTCKQISSHYQSLMVYGYRGSNLTCAVYKKLPNTTRNDQHSLKTSQNIAIYLCLSTRENTWT